MLLPATFMMNCVVPLLIEMGDAGLPLTRLIGVCAKVVGMTDPASAPIRAKTRRDEETEAFTKSFRSVSLQMENAT